MLQRATAALSAAATPEQVAATAAEQFAGLARAGAVTLWLLHGTGDEAVLEPVLGATDDPASPPRRIAVTEPVAPAEAARTREPGVGRARQRHPRLHPPGRRRRAASASSGSADSGTCAPAPHAPR